MLEAGAPLARPGVGTTFPTARPAARPSHLSAVSRPSTSPWRPSARPFTCVPTAAGGTVLVTFPPDRWESSCHACTAGWPAGRPGLHQGWRAGAPRRGAARGPGPGGCCWQPAGRPRARRPGGPAPPGRPRAPSPRTPGPRPPLPRAPGAAAGCRPAAFAAARARHRSHPRCRAGRSSTPGRTGCARRRHGADGGRGSRVAAVQLVFFFTAGGVPSTSLGEWRKKK